MICEKCWDELEGNFVGARNNDGQECIGISRTKNGHFAFSDDFYAIYISYEEPTKNGKNKGQMKKGESIHLMKTNFCCVCGDKKVTT